MSSLSPRSRARIPLIIVAIAFTAAMLRSPVVAVAPVARLIQEDLGTTATVLGLFTAIPVFAFAISSPIGVAVVKRGGANFALTVCLSGAVVGCVIRSLDGLVVALIGTAIMGVFITIGNVVVPVIIAREFPPARIHLMTGVYTSAINLGTTIVTVGTAPLAEGLGWRGAVVSWAGFGVAGLAVWVALHGLRGAFAPRPADKAPGGAAPRSVARDASTWWLGAAFAGQAFSFYSITAWLPTLLGDQGFELAAAGAISALLQVSGIAGSLLLPVVTTRFSVLVGVVYVAVGWSAVPIGFLVAPDLWWLWCLLGGVAQGGGLTVVFIMIGALGGSQDTVAGRSGLVQGVGYALAATGPTIVGALHEQTDAWVLPMLVILGSVLLFGIAGGRVAAQLRTHAADVPAPVGDRD